ncbi:MAG: helix-turn-helix domain-containing protein [Leucobacter sp.]
MNAQLSGVIGSAHRSRAEIAQRAGIHRSTMYRVLEGSTDVRVDTLHELALACGFQLELRYRPVSDPIAADAGRTMLDAHVLAVNDPEILAWIERLERYAGEQPVEIAAEAGAASSLLHREDAIGMVGDFSIDRLASAGHAMSGDWALSGAASLEALGAEECAGGTVVLWVQDPTHAYQLLSDTGRRTPELDGSDLIICAPGKLTLLGSVDLEGIHLVAPTQAIIDNLGLGPTQREIARKIAQDW